MPSFPRKRESILGFNSKSTWIPAFAGMTKVASEQVEIKKGNKMKKIIFIFLMTAAIFTANFASAEADLEINTPAINAIKASMTARHNTLLPHYNSGAVGITNDAFIAVKDATAVPLKDRGGIAGLVADENADRAKLYKEIASANKHPEWEGGIRNTFAGRWVEKALAGWWYQGKDGWVKK